MISCLKGNRRNYIRRLAALSITAAFLLPAWFCGEGFAAAKKASAESFSSPEAAVDALLQAIKSKDGKRLISIFGPEAGELVYSGDPVADDVMYERALEFFEQNSRIVKSGEGKAILEVGADNWPLPIPIVENNGKWSFDTKAGKEEILHRRIGRNELSAIEVCRGYVEAQREYAAVPRDGTDSLAYAQKFFSEPGKQDGLYWEATREGQRSPLGIFVANAHNEGYKKNRTSIPYHGYFYTILKAQGKNAEGGAYDYVVRGKMIGGFALVAYPAKYGSSGMMTFIVNHDGEVYQKDLGPKTTSIAQAMKLFDPDKTWRKVQ